ncbi:hypothetical protein [Sporosarcina sp. NCCP-2716]|uniref:hypothetical protein n=1 Tax=Sporosarcina sp. NCCP-2716 TaxID=2943679 RepID=UPI002040ABB1|nr:hypothetical protein [Sporosarcina sp. NCCP-2716]
MFNWIRMRVTGLALSSALYATMTVCYALSFPSIGTITFGCMTVFTLLSIPLVKHTTIRHKKA